MITKMIASGSDRPDILYSQSPALYTFLNPVSYLKARNNNSLFLRFDGILADGQLLVLAVGLLYGKRIRRRSFDMTSLADGLFRHARDNGKTVCLVGGKEGEAERTAGLLQQHYPGIRIEGCGSDTCDRGRFACGRACDTGRRDGSCVSGADASLGGRDGSVDFVSR